MKKAMTKHPLYRTWRGMIYRCEYPSGPLWYNYGSRSIKVCDEWHGEDGFWRFVDDMGEKPSPRHTLDRIDSEGNYEPANCRWAEPYLQALNTRTRKVKEPNMRNIFRKGYLQPYPHIGWTVLLRHDNKSYRFHDLPSHEEALRVRNDLIRKLGLEKYHDI